MIIFFLFLSYSGFYHFRFGIDQTRRRPLMLLGAPSRLFESLLKIGHAIRHTLDRWKRNFIPGRGVILRAP
jgi:hypothetical protein